MNTEEKDISSHTIINKISIYIEHLFLHKSVDENIKDPFYLNGCCKYSFLQYIFRLMKYTKTEISTFFIAVIYFEYYLKTSNFTFSQQIKYKYHLIKQDCSF